MKNLDFSKLRGLVDNYRQSLLRPVLTRDANTEARLRVKKTSGRRHRQKTEDFLISRLCLRPLVFFTIASASTSPM